jgi:hypothetical protein
LFSDCAAGYKVSGSIPINGKKISSAKRLAARPDQDSLTGGKLDDA